MAVPTIVGVGAAASGAGAITPAFPGGYTATANDVAITFLECESTDTIVVPSGWTQLAAQTVTTGTVTELTAVWRRIQAGDTAPTYNDPGNHQVGRMIIIRGCATSGNPWDVATTAQETVSDTSVSMPDVTTLGADRLILNAFSTGRDVASTAEASAWTNGNLANLTERMDDWTSSGLGGGFAMATGEKASAGATGATTATVALANFKALMTIALKPASPPKTVAATRVAYAETTWTGTGTTKLAGSVSWLTGDVIVVLGMTADDSTTLSAPTVSGLTFTAVGASVGSGNMCWGHSWSATAASDGSGQVQGNASNTTNSWGIAVWVFRGCDGTGARATNASTAKTVSLTRGDDKSRVVEILGDWSAGSVASRVWTPGSETEDEATQDSSFYTVFVADWGDQGSAGATSYGISGTASTGDHTKIALEILGTTGAVDAPPHPTIVSQAVHRAASY